MSNVCKEETFKKLFLDLSKSIRDFFYYKTGNIQSAEDLMQEAFGKLWENCAKVPEQKAKSYLFTVANNRFLTQREHRKVVLKFERKGHSQKTNIDPQFLMEEEELKKQLEVTISKLPENQRLVFLMNRIDKKKYREIAEELNISIKTVEKRMHKALLALRKVVKKI